MRKNVFKSTFTCIALGVSTMLLQPGSMNAAGPALLDECSKELLLSYFPEAFVNDTLKRFNIPQEKWAGINQSLATKDKEVVKIVEQKAAALTPNPLKDPQQRQAAVKIFRETLLQVFTEALKENGIQDANQFQAMLDDIQQQKAKKFAQCMEKHREETEKSVSDSKSSSEDMDDDDDEGDEDDEDDEDDDLSKKNDSIDGKKTSGSGNSSK